MTSQSREMTGSRPTGRGARRILIVDLPEAARDALPRRLVDTGYDDVRHMTFSEISVAAVREISPDAILAPLLTGRFDAVELAEYLALIEFDGHLIIVSDLLPKPVLVQREISRAAPLLTLELYELNGGNSLRSVHTEPKA